MKRKALGGDHMANPLSVERPPPPPCSLLLKTKNKTKPGSHVAQVGLRFPIQPKITFTS